MRAALRSALVPQNVLAILPFLLFFPSGVLYVGVLLFLLALALSGGYREKLQRICAHPLFYPVLGILGVTTLIALFQDHSVPRFASAFAHYQIYLFLLGFIAVGGGAWQRRAIHAFMAGAVMAATLFYLRAAGLLPPIALFTNIQHYSGNNSIMIGIMLALAAPMLLFDATMQETRKAALFRLALFAYVGFALLFFASTRTGAVIFVVLCGLVLLWVGKRWPGRALALLAVLVVIGLISWQASSTLRARALQTVVAAKSVDSTAEKDVRIDLYQTAAGMVVEKPWFGHGIGQWLSLNRERAETDAARSMTTPHNDYLLYAAEIGIVGLGAFLWTWVSQLWLAARINGAMGMYLLMITLGLLLGGAFNAILRDLVFGMPFMILLAIPLAGLRRSGAAEPAGVATSKVLTEQVR